MESEDGRIIGREVGDDGHPAVGPHGPAADRITTAAAGNEAGNEGEKSQVWGAAPSRTDLEPGQGVR